MLLTSSLFKSSNVQVEALNITDWHVVCTSLYALEECGQHSAKRQCVKTSVYKSIQGATTVNNKASLAASHGNTSSHVLSKAAKHIVTALICTKFTVMHLVSNITNTHRKD